MKFIFLLFSCIFFKTLCAQKDSPGTITGVVLDEKTKPLQGATVTLQFLTDSTKKTTVTEKDGSFNFLNIPYGLQKLTISFTGLQTVVIDSLNLRAEKSYFNLNEIVLKPGTAQNMNEVIVYAEKPLIQSKDGNITFNAGESPLSAGSNASDLLTNVPLISKDPSGKLLVRGKEPKILIDDKPVELNLQQLQDLLESMPGSSIEKIEVMTNPPPQYANEQGGVINIVTKKGSVGVTGRISINGGTRGEAGANGSFNYRRQGLVVNVAGGAGYNRFESMGSSIRENFYTDSTNFFRTTSNNINKSVRPNLRASMDYDISKLQSLSINLNFNQNNFDNSSYAVYKNLNRFEEIYRLSERSVMSTGDNQNYNAGLSYTLHTKKAGETLKLFTNANRSNSTNDRDFYQQFFNPDQTFTGQDSTQKQLNKNKSSGYSARLAYDVPFFNNKTFISTGGYYNLSLSDIDVQATYKRKSDGVMVKQEAISNNFTFHQYIANVRGSVKQIIATNFSATAGLAAEQTGIRFELFKNDSSAKNNYWSLLPFANINKTWKDILNLTVSYRRSIRRPGINELNPTIDVSDPYTTRTGNPDLKPSMVHNFDLVLGHSKKSFYANLGLGYNIVQDIFSQIRTPITESKTLLSWQNISTRKEYELSSWSGYTVNKKVRVNASASYTYNVYGAYDKEVRKFRDGGSFTSNLNGSYTFSDLYNTTTSFTYNHFANPQGTVRSTVSMNIGLQAKMLQKKLTATFNIIDPFTQQQYKTTTFGTNYQLTNTNITNTHNFRLTLSYNLTKKVVKKNTTTPANKKKLQKLLTPKN